MSGETSTYSEETTEISGSPSFTPTNRDKPLPVIDTATSSSSPESLLQSLMEAWYTPKSESPLNDSSLQNLYKDSKGYSETIQSQDSQQWGAIDGRLQQKIVDSLSESPISYSSSSQIDSTRLSCSTLASSGMQTGSESSAATSPQGYGFALGSPRRDQRGKGVGSESNHHVGPFPIGLGLSEEQLANVMPANGPFSHHRKPSWTLQSIMTNTTSPAAAPSPTDSDTIMPTWPVSVPARGTSRSRSNSYASNKTRQGKLSGKPLEESFPLPIRSASSHSIASTTADSSLSHVSPRTSSLKKSKSRPKLSSKASEPTLTTLGSLQSPSTSKINAGSIEEAHRGLTGWTQKRTTASATVGSSNTMRDLHDYLAYTAGNTMDLLPASPINTKAMAEEGILVLTEGVTLDDLEAQVGPKTTHLLLSACQETSLVEFLNRVLPIVGPSLVVLDVSKSSLAHLPDSIIHCTNIEELNISSVAFSRPWNCHALSRLSTLRVLLADSCKFVIVPAEIAQLQMLKTLSLQHNNLSHLPSWLHRLTILQRLYLDGNPFQGSWQQVCQAFIAQELSRSIPSSTHRPIMDRNPDSAPGRMDMSDETPFEEYEEMADEVPITAPIMHKSKEEKSTRPLMRRMMSTSSDTPLEDHALGIDLASSRPRRLSQGLENGGEKKWGSLIRKLGKKASTTQIPLSTPSSTPSSPGKSRSNSLHQRQLTKMTQPLTPMGWQDQSGDSSWSSSFSKRDSFLAISQDGPEVHHRRKLLALMQYLKDLDDLSALRLGPTGTVLAMETSMASTYSSPSKDMANMDRSGSETSRESMHSTSSSSSASQIPSEQSSDRGMAATQMTKDDAHRRIRILQEIVATEETYIRGLKELVDIYVVPSAATDSSNGQSIVPLADQRHVFANVEGIFHFHQSAFLPALRLVTQSIVNTSEAEVERLRSDVEGYNAMSANLTEQVADVFTKHAAYFRMYTAYVNNVEAAQKRVAHWKLTKTSDGSSLGFTAAATTAPSADGSAPLNLSPKERKRIKVFLQRAKLDPRHSQLSLETYLHLPVQRIPRYRLLFEDLVRSCPTHRLKDSAAISRALDSICSVATQMNESKRQSENDRKLLEWQARIKGQFASPLLQPHRKLIRDGELLLKRVVMRTTAFHMAKSQWLEEECQQSTQCDGSVTDTDLGIVQVDCLNQQSMNKTVHVLLCNDITVVVVKDDPFAGQNSPVDLFAVLRIQSPVELVGQTTLRVVDPKHILYFSAFSPAQAQQWKAAMLSVHQEPRIVKASKASTLY